MPVLLAEHPDAAFPDRAPRGSGLRATLTSGAGGRALTLTRAADLSTFCSRIMLRVSRLEVGQVTLVRACNESGAATLSLRYSAENRSVTLLMSTGQSITSAPLTSLDWHCVEFDVDIGQGCASLWIDGLCEGQLTLTTEVMLPLISRRFQLGAMDQSADAIGEVDLDEWLLAGERVGPVIVTPTHDHGADPTRWLVVFNRNSADSASLAQSYRAARKVPWANLLGLDLLSDETITPSAFASLAQGVNDYVDRWFPSGQIMGILTCPGVPGFVDFGATIEPVPALLQNSATTEGAIANDLATGELLRPGVTNMSAHRMTARIDGPTLAQAQSLLDRAAQLETHGLSSGDDATLFLSLDAAPTEANAPALTALLEWAGSLDRMKTRLPLRKSTDEPRDEPGDERRFTSAQRDGFFWGLVSHEPGPTFFASTGGARAILAPLHLQAASCTSLRDGSSEQWISTALAAGYASAIGTSRAADPARLPDCARFFEALRRGWSLAEAWMVSSPYLRERYFLVGDPLLSLQLPRAGWEVFGPLDQVQELDPELPAVVLRDAERTLNLSALLDERDEATFALRRTDAQGETSALAMIRARNRGSAFESFQPPLLPLWPSESSWPVMMLGEQLHACAIWEAPLASMGIAEVHLIELRDGQTRSLLTITPQPRIARVSAQLSLPDSPARWAWRIVDRDSRWVQTPWSALTPRLPARAMQITEIKERP